MKSVIKYLVLLVHVLGICFYLQSCAQEEIVDTSEFIIDENHKIELVASEPNVILPVAMVEDNQNRFWVVEMPGYMRDIDGNDEDLPDGRIVILSDDDQDGKIDNRKIFLDNLVNPRAICLVYDGVLYTEGTMLKWAELQDDLPINTIVVDSFYVVGGNIEHQPNGLIYNLDNWIYSAKSNARYRRIDGNWKKEPTTFRGQWGISNDRLGRLIYNHNSAPLIGDFSIPNQNLDNPYLQLEQSTGRYLTDNMRIYPIQATSVNRGYQPNVLDSLGKVINYTSACAPHLYYGDKMGTAFHGSAFVCAPEANLIAHYSYDENSLKAKRTLGEKEFLISKDESFRPVNLMTGLDGSLYVVDMRKGIIQHSAYMSSYLREAITRKRLDQINGKGRLYRISKNDSKYTPKPLVGLSPPQILDLFSDSNLQVRLFAQKAFVSRNDKSDFPLIHTLAASNSNPISQIHALWTLEGLGFLNAEHIIKVAQGTSNIDVLAQLIILSKSFDFEDSPFNQLYQKCFDLKSMKLDFLLASVVGNSPKTEELWFQIARRYPSDKLINESLVSSIGGRESYFAPKIIGMENEILNGIVERTLINMVAEDIQSPILLEKPFDDDRTNGLKKYKTYCASCHGLDGKGQKNVAPSFKASSIIDGDEIVIASIILNGYTSGEGAYEMMMPAYREDKNMSDQDIYDIISYLKSTYTSGWNAIKVEEIAELRKY